MTKRFVVKRFRKQFDRPTNPMNLFDWEEHVKRLLRERNSLTGLEL